MAGSSAKDDFADADDDERRGLIPLAAATAKHAVLAPIRPFVSPPALKAYLTTLLVALAACVLFGLAITAYSLFYHSYLPRIGFERTVHLQFDHVYAPHTTLAHHAHPYPYGTVALAPDLVTQQAYDIWIDLALPRTVENKDAGNFMLSVELYGPDRKGTTTTPATPPSAIHPDPTALLAASRRPAILPYRSRPVDALHTLTQIPWYLLGIRSETASLHVPVFERVSFPRGSQHLPATLRLEIQSTHRLQIYTATALFRARFTGLRWLMYNHRIISAVFFISAFWITELVFAGVAWGVLSTLLARREDLAKTKEEEEEEDEGVKRERTDDDDEQPPPLSDTERTFPTLPGRPPLRYSPPPPEIKREAGEEGAVFVPEVVTKGAEADVEDEDNDDEEEEDVDFFDSGIGTGLESSSGPARRESMRRRRGGRPGQRTLTPGSSGSGSTLPGGEE